MELRTSDQWINIVFGLPCWNGEGKFKTMCKNIKKLVESDFYFEGNQSNTQAYDIIWSLMKKYYAGKIQPMTQVELRKCLDMKTGTRNRKNYTKLKDKLIDHYKNYEAYNTKPDSIFPQN